MPETLDAWQLASNDVVQDPIEQATHESDTLYAEDHLEAIGPIALIALPGTEAFANKVNAHLVQRRQEDLANNSHLEEQRGYFRKNYIIDCQIQRSGTGEGKAFIHQTVRGHDVFILIDVLNYSVSYPYYGMMKPVTPDEHYQNLRSAISAVSGKAKRINVIMPYLYEGRQHKRNMRESLDCAYMLEELGNLGVENIITFDAHDPRVSNAIPLKGFETIQSAYQMFKAIFRELGRNPREKTDLMVVSPDEGGIDRAMYYAAMLGCPLGTFYKRRDYTVLQDGKNPIVAHQSLGKSPKGMDVIIVDDMISSGSSMLDIAHELKARDAQRIYCISTFGLFTAGLEPFNEAYEKGYIDKIFCTNLIYRTPELLAAPWYVDVDMSKFVGLLIDSINMDRSLSPLVTPTKKIQSILKEHGIKGGQLPDPMTEA